MKFMYPQVLWALSALLIPIVIHLFNFKKYKTLYFSSLHFLKKVDEQARSTKQLKRWLILIARLLVYTFIVFAFAQPYFITNESKPSPNQPVLIHIDNSFSMQAQGSSGELLSMVKEKCKEIIKAQAHDQLYIVSTNSLSGREERLMNKSDAIEKIDKLNYSAIGRSISSVVDWQNQTINKLDPESKWQAPRSYFFSDFQANSAGVELDKLTRIAFIPIVLKPENTDNLFIDSLWFSDPVNRIGKLNQLNIRVRNNSKEDLSNVELEFTGDRENKIVFLDIAANSSAESSITVSNKKAGIHGGMARIADQNIYFDDAFYYSYSVEKNVNVLIINGEDATPNVNLIYSLDSYYKVEEKDVSSFTRDDIKGKDLIVLNGLNELASGTEGLLSDALESGSSIGAFPGKNPNLNDWNRFLSKHQVPIFRKAGSSGNKISELNYSDPFFEGVFDNKPEKLKLPGVSNSFASPASGNSANKLITLQNGLSLFSYTKKTGNLFVFYSSLHPDFGNFVNDALCSTLFLRMGELSKRQRPIQLNIGSSAVYPVYTELKPEESIRMKNDDVDLIPARSEINGVHFIDIKNAAGIEDLAAGNYELLADKKVGVLSLNYSRLESDLNQLNEQDISRIFEAGSNSVELKEISSDSQFNASEVEKSSGLWRSMVLLALLFIAIEMLLVRFLK
jgi:hypothetical protein